MKSTLVLIISGNSFKITDGSVVAASGEIYCYSGCWTLISGYVRREYRGIGLHNRLIRARVKEVFRRGGKSVRAWVATGNFRCLNNLVEEGFRFVETKKRKFGRVEHVCLVLQRP